MTHHQTPTRALPAAAVVAAVRLVLLVPAHPVTIRTTKMDQEQIHMHIHIKLLNKCKISKGKYILK